MDRKSYGSITDPDSKQLAVIICDWLLDESFKDIFSEEKKSWLESAQDCIEKVYSIGFTDYGFKRLKHSLEEIYDFGYHPIPVKDRIAADSHKRKGNESMELKIYGLAEKDYTEALKLNPRNAIYFCNRAASRIRKGDLMSAVTDCSRALELDRCYSKAYCWLGIVHALMNHPSRALRCYQEALEIEPDNEIYQANLDLINRRLNQPTFKVLQPLIACNRKFVQMTSRMTSHKALFKNKDYKVTDPNLLVEKAKSFEKFTLEALD